MYYCWKCRKWHKSGNIARRHTVFSAKKKRPDRPKPSTFRPKTVRPRSTPRAVKKLRARAPILTITRKKKAIDTQPSKKKHVLKKARIGLSKMRRGQIAMRPEDLYEGQMVKRLRKETGMTHVQVMNLVNLAKKSDYIDVETEISSVSGLSRDKTELYEFAKRNILEKLKRQQSGTEYYSNMNKKQLDFEIWKYEDMQMNWLEEQKRKKAWGKMNLI